MPDQATAPTLPTTPSATTEAAPDAPTEVAALLPALARAVLAVPGVVRLEPTLSTSGPKLLLHRRPTDGIRLVTRAQSADCDINIATTAGHQARAVAHQIQATIGQTLSNHGYDTTTITVAVLTIEPQQAPQPSNAARHEDDPGQRTP